jgi:uncharacterized protein
MAEELYITTSKPAEAALDYDRLRLKGIEYIQEMASGNWTDYNIHDPGLTILEFLCYAITELSFRTTFPVQDLLAANAKPDGPGQKHFFSAKEILPNKALSLRDFRKLLIDIEGIRNAWLQKRERIIYADTIENRLIPADSGKKGVKPVHIKGYYDVLLEFDHLVPEKKRPEITRQAREVLNANRNLCEDFLKIDAVQKQEFVLCSEIEIETDTDPYDYLARLFYRIQKYLTPPLLFRTLDEMISDGTGPDEIFNGPLLTHGFIKDADLDYSELKQEIFLSDIIGEIMNEKGTRAIRDIVFNPPGITRELPDKWHVEVSEGSRPVISVEKSRVLLYKNRMPFRSDMKEVKKRFEELMNRDVSSKYAAQSGDIRFSAGRFRNLSEYYSVQNHFPLTYGLSSHGLLDSAGAERKAAAMQLKGYLLLFDQLLSNYFSQLGNIRSLFSLEDEDNDGNPLKIKSTYFTRMVDSFKDYHKLYLHDDPEKQIYELLEKHDGKPGGDHNDFFERRNRFLDHLLARYSENFREYAWMLYSINPLFSIKDVLDTKVSFLRDYPGISSGRASAFNYADSAGVWDSYNVSGLEKRIARLLGIKNYKRRNLSDIHYEIYEQKDDNDIEELRFRVIDKDNNNKILISSSTRYLSKEAAISEMKTAIRFGMERSGYEIKETKDDRFYFNLIDPDKGLVVARRIEYFQTLEQAEEAVDYVIGFIHQQYSDEGMFLVEHLLMFPESSTHYMPVCEYTDCTGCGEPDPYSFRISIVLPAYTKRFLNMDFRNYVERVIREEVPSHIFPRICWINPEQMNEFERKYRAWLDVKAGNRRDAREQALKELIAILSSLKNVYPSGRLQDCSDEKEKSLFILNQKAIGSLK